MREQGISDHGVNIIALPQKGPAFGKMAQIQINIGDPALAPQEKLPYVFFLEVYAASSTIDGKLCEIELHGFQCDFI